MAKNWSRLECELIVDDYFCMLAAECRDEPYNKAEHRRGLQRRLGDRSKGSIEFKHQNISAVLIRAGHVYIRGYKPAWNYQDLLETVVTERISSDTGRIVEIEDSVIERLPVSIELQDARSVIVDPPERIPEKTAREFANRRPRIVNYAEREQKNMALGEKGEAFVLEFERRRLVEVGREDLVDDIEWTSKEKGDGAGYDIRSFEDDTDEPRYIEVKTTNSGKYQPFMISANEVRFSDEHADHFALYRLFDFAREPLMFVLDGAVVSHVDLRPTMFRASY